MRPKEIIALGVPRGKPLEMAIEAIRHAAGFSVKKGALRQAIRRVVKDPAGARSDETFGALAEAIIDAKRSKSSFVAREQPAPYRQWGTDLEPGAVTPTCTLPGPLQLHILLSRLQNLILFYC